MSGYRDSNEADRARADALERELDELRTAKQRDDELIATLEFELAGRRCRSTSAPAHAGATSDAPAHAGATSDARANDNQMIIVGTVAVIAVIAIILMAIFSITR